MARKARRLVEEVDNTSLGTPLLSQRVHSQRSQESDQSKSEERKQEPEELLLRAESRVGEVKDARLHANINKRLRKSQRSGVSFLFKLYSMGVGGILNDDMGFGKTLQVIAFIAAVLGRQGVAGEEYLRSPSDPMFLLVVPTNVLENWRAEIAKWCPLAIAIFHGKAKRTAVQQAENRLVDVLLTTHSQVTINAMSETAERKLIDIPFDAVFLDEAHAIKNAATQLHQAMQLVNTRVRIGLTGTLLTNDPVDLFNVVNWVVPGLLGSWSTFEGQFDKPIKEGRKASATDEQLLRADQAQLDLQRLLKRYVLRRKKEDVEDPDLQGKEEFVILCNMSPLQRRIYERLLQSADFQLFVNAEQECPCGSGEIRLQCQAKECKGPIYRHMDHSEHGLACPKCFFGPAIALLLYAATHHELLKINPTSTPSEQEKQRVKAKVAFNGEEPSEVGGLYQDYNLERLAKSEKCGKMQVLKKLLSDWREKGDKVLIFSRFKRLLNILERFLVKQGYRHSKIDGDTAASTRFEIAQHFNNDASVFVLLVSTAAGNVGMNLVGANKVVLFDPSWVPAQDSQAQDRAHRPGQKKQVSVYRCVHWLEVYTGTRKAIHSCPLGHRLLSAGSIEELMYERQVYKTQLANVILEGSDEPRYFDAVQGDQEQKGELFGIANIFTRSLEELRLQRHISREKDVSDFAVTNVDEQGSILFECSHSAVLGQQKETYSVTAEEQPDRRRREKSTKAFEKLARKWGCSTKDAAQRFLSMTAGEQEETAREAENLVTEGYP